MKPHNALEDNSIFIEVFGNSPVMKVLDFLITFADFDYPLTEIARNSGCGLLKFANLLGQTCKK